MSIASAGDGKPVSVPKSAHLLCGWPLVMVLFGGGLGGAAYGVNLIIYKSRLPVVGKVILNVVTGLGAVVIWAFIAAAIQSMRK